MLVAAYCWGAAASAASPMPPFVPSTDPNMNGEYFSSATPGQQQQGTRALPAFHTYPGGVSYFDVYSPTISTLYSQVFWTGLPPVAVPEEVRQRYAGGKAMAIVGIETDQVRPGAGPNGEDVSVPINMA